LNQSWITPSAVFVNTDQIFTLQQIFEKSWEYTKDIYTQPGSSWKALGSVMGVWCWRPPDTGHQSPHSCSEICVHVRQVKSQPFRLVLDSDMGVCCHYSFL